MRDGAGRREEGGPEDPGLRPITSALLRYGMLVAAAAILAGLLLLLIQVGPRAFVSMPRLSASESGSDLTSLRSVLRELLPPEPQAVMEAGILLLIATPMVTVGASAVTFAREGDWLYALIAASVFSMLILGFALGRGIAPGGG